MSKKLESEQSRRLGEVLATLHTTMDDFESNFSRPALSSDYLLDCSLDVITPLFKHRQNDIAYLQKQIEKINELVIFCGDSMRFFYPLIVRLFR